ncbi:MAG TPA: hypothetical protein VF187_06830 [Gemmatimonadales bacterium]
MPKVSTRALERLETMDKDLGRWWNLHARAARASDELLRVPIADGVFTTKIDGWMHAFAATNRSVIKYASDPEAGLDISTATAWSGGNAALRYARWQADFHWRIDTRLWQYMLYYIFIRRAYRDVIGADEVLTDEEKAQLLELVYEFFDEVLVAYTYRIEVIERSRNFAPHPDPTAGSSNHGYTYFKLWDMGDLRFDELPLDFLGKQVRGEVVDDRKAPPPFPPADSWPLDDDSFQAAQAWLDEAIRSGMADRWMSVPLGERNVPTRLDGWVASMQETLRFYKPYAAGGRAAVDGREELNGLDLRDYAVRFGCCHAEFYRKLRGEAQQLARLLSLQKVGLKRLLAPEETQHLEAFVERALDAIQRVFAEGIEVTPEDFPELQVARPLHPRYAPVDPMEPLPWQQPDSERYLQRMIRMGYIL